jgi:hypothetical protein
MMHWWRRIFGLDPIDLTIHVTVTGLVAGVLSTSGGNEETIVLGVLALGTVLYAWRRQRALRTLPAPPLEDYERARIEDLEARMADLEAAHGRLLELEERLDFTERMLARSGEPAALPREPGESR